MTEKLLKLQQNIYDYYSASEKKYGYQYNFNPRFSFFRIGDLFTIYYYGPGYEDDPSMKASNMEGGYNYGYAALLDFLTVQENADKILSLVFDSEDEGANGVNEWRFDRLFNSDVTFPNLEEFKVRLTNPGDHNTSTINYDEEDGTVAKLVAKMPALKVLQVPSAPNASFFELEHSSLQYMVIQSGWDNQSFLENLANHKGFPNLYGLDFAEILDTFNDLEEDSYTSVETFKALFTSKIFTNEKRSFHFKLRNSRLTKEQLFEIQRVNPKVQFLYINTHAGQYVNHMMKNEGK